MSSELFFFCYFFLAKMKRANKLCGMCIVQRKSTDIDIYLCDNKKSKKKKNDDKNNNRNRRAKRKGAAGKKTKLRN